MEGSKEFQGKDLDAAIAEACSYFNAAREKLEIEIIQDAKTGIFGIVGARKAKVRARRAHLREAVESILGKDSVAGGNHATELNVPRGQAQEAESERQEHTPRPRQDKDTARDADSRKGRRPAAEAPAGADAPVQAVAEAVVQADSTDVAATSPASHTDAQDAVSQGCAPCCSQEPSSAAPQADAAQACNCGATARPVAAEAEGAAAAEGKSGSKAGAKSAGKAGAKATAKAAAHERSRSRSQNSGRDTRMAETALQDDELDEAGEGLPLTPVEELDAARLEALVTEAVCNLVRPVVGEAVRVGVTLAGGRVQVSVDCDEDSGLLIGREGQTLASLQYLVSRIVSRGMNAAVRVQLDAGEYRRRQDEKLCEMALALAEKVRETGRSFSTRPLSSYHRRIVHMCLQEVTDVQTRSSGDGAMKRVVIMRRKADKGQNQE